MNNINKLLIDPPANTGIHISCDNKSAYITGTPQGFLLLSKILEIQAKGEGNKSTPCMTAITPNESGAKVNAFR